MTDLPLYPSEAQIARMVLGPGRTTEWNALAVMLEREGFPPIDQQFGGRYWPKCELWFRVRNGMLSIAPSHFGPPDGGETCPSPRKRRVSESAPAATVHRLHIGAREPTS